MLDSMLEDLAKGSDRILAAHRISFVNANMTVGGQQDLDKIV
jgi:hypothetical protein